MKILIVDDELNMRLLIQETLVFNLALNYNILVLSLFWRIYARGHQASR